jgi:hypothetical protein
MASAELSRRVAKIVAYPPLWGMGEQQRLVFQWKQRHPIR